MLEIRLAFVRLVTQNFCMNFASIFLIKNKIIQENNFEFICTLVPVEIMHDASSSVMVKVFV